MYITRLASNEIFSPSNKIHREVGRAKDLAAPLYKIPVNLDLYQTVIIIVQNITDRMSENLFLGRIL